MLNHLINFCFDMDAVCLKSLWSVTCYLSSIKCNSEWLQYSNWYVGCRTHLLADSYFCCNYCVQNAACMLKKHCNFLPGIYIVTVMDCLARVLLQMVFYYTRILAMYDLSSVNNKHTKMSQLAHVMPHSKIALHSCHHSSLIFLSLLNTKIEMKDCLSNIVA